MRRSDDLIYVGMEHLLLQHGRFFMPAPLPARIRPMTPKHCFDNVYKLCARFKSLHYAEGIALAKHLIPLHHAWAVTKDGTVVDPTWKDAEAYFGVVIPTTRVRAARRIDHCSVLQDWTRGHQILRTPFDFPQTIGRPSGAEGRA